MNKNQMDAQLQDELTERALKNQKLTSPLFNKINESNSYIDFYVEDVTITIFDDGDMGFEVNYPDDRGSKNIAGAEHMKFINEIRTIKGWV